MCCIVNLPCDGCFRIISAWVLSVLWKNTCDILWEQKIIYCRPSAQFNSCGADFKWYSILWERDLRSKFRNRLCLRVPSVNSVSHKWLCQASLATYFWTVNHISSMIIRAEWMINPKCISQLKQKIIFTGIFCWFFTTRNAIILLEMSTYSQIHWLLSVYFETMSIFPFSCHKISCLLQRYLYWTAWLHTALCWANRCRLSRCCFSPSGLPLSHINKPIWLFGSLNKQ